MGGSDSAFLSQNGYTRLPSGLVIQWGLATPNTTIYFPIPFPNAVYSITVTKDRGTTAHWSSLGVYEVATHHVTLSSFQVYIHFNDAAFKHRWMAIGY